MDIHAYILTLRCSRARKVRCDGARPECWNCCRRDDPLAIPCSYDVTPRRRGQDRIPGARKVGQKTTTKTRTTRSRAEEEAKRIKGKAKASEQESTSHSELSSLPPPASSPLLRPDQEHLSAPSISPEASFSTSLLDDLELAVDADPFCMQVSYPVDVHMSSSEDDEASPPHISISPSTQFTRETWWDTLLASYAPTDSDLGSALALTSAARDAASQRVIAELRFMFRQSIYWFSFFNIPRFFGALLDPLSRTAVQPSLILGALALATFFQSSEVEGGAKGRAKALKLLERAHAAFDASLASGWTDVGLVQAAWVSRLSAYLFPRGAPLTRHAAVRCV